MSTIVKVQVKIIKDKCYMWWTGKVKKRKKIQVKIPAGIDDGQQLRVAGQGEPGVNGGPCRRFIYCIPYSDHMSFLNVMVMIFIVKCQLHLFRQHLGDEIEVPTLHGKVKLKIPAGTQTGTKFRLRGKGVPNVQRTWKVINISL